MDCMEIKHWISKSLVELRQPLIDGQLVYLQHLKVRHFLLSSQNLELKKSFFQKIGNKIGFKSKAQKQLVGGSKAKFDDNFLWEIIRCQSYTQMKTSFIDYKATEIWFDDYVFLRHYKTQALLLIDQNYQSQTTKQFQAYCSNDESQGQLARAIFQIQRIDDPYLQWKNNATSIDQRIHNNSRVRIVNVISQLTLHSHIQMYKQPNGSHLHEVTGFQGRDINDIWEIQIGDNDLHSQFQHKVKPYNQLRIMKTIHHQDRVIIKNAYFGCCLDITQNHQQQYQLSCSLQIPRNQSTWFEIEQVDEDKLLTSESGTKVMIQERSNRISRNSLVNFFHPQSQKHLKFKGDRSLMIIGIECGFLNFDGLLINYPFVIRHLKSQSYLRAVKQEGNRFEIEFADFVSYETIWQIEKSDSIFC